MAKVRFNRQQALQDGLSEQEINLLIAQQRQAGNEVIDDSPAPTAQPKQDLASSLGQSIIGMFTQPLAKVTTGVVDGTQNAVSTAKLLANRGSEEDYNRIVRDKSFGKSNKTLLEGTAGLASLMVPGGSAAKGATNTGLISKALASLRAGAETGAKSGALYGASQDTGDLYGIVGNATLGAGIGAPLNLASSIIGKTGNVMQGAKGAAERSIVNPQVKATPFYQTNADDLVKASQDFGLKGTAKNRVKQLPEIFKSLQGQVDEVITNDKSKIPLEVVSKNFDDALAKSNFVPDIPEYDKSKKIFEEKLLKSFADDATSDATSLYKLKQDLGSELSPVFKKIEKGNPLTPKEEVRMALYESVKNTLDNVSPEIREVNKKQAALFDLSEGLVKKANEKSGFGIGQFSIPLPNQVAQKATEIGAGAVAGQGRLMSFLNSFSPKTQSPTTVGLLNLLTGSQQSDQTNNESYSPTDQNQYSQGNNQLNGQYNQSNQLTPPTIGQGNSTPNSTNSQMTDYSELMQLLSLQDLQQTGGKNLSKIETLGKILGIGEEKETQLSAKQRENIAKLNSADVFLDNFEQQLGGIGLQENGLMARLKGTVDKGTGAIGLNPKVKVYEDLRDGLRSMLVKNLGESGSLSDTDIQRAVKLIPTVSDSKEEADLKLMQIRKIIEGARVSQSY